MSSFFESKKLNKLVVDNKDEVKNLSLAPLIVEGGSIFKKTAYFLNSILIGPNREEKEGIIAYNKGLFMGYNGENWVKFGGNDLWKEGDGILYTDGHKIGINKINPKKMLEVGGDVSIDKKLLVRDEVTLESGLLLNESIGKKWKGFIRFFENNFEGYDGDKWVKFGGVEAIQQEIKIPEINLDQVDKIKLLNCPLTFTNNANESHFYYDWDRNEYRLEKLHKNFNSIKLEDLSLGNLKVNGDIIFQDGGRKTIKNVGDPVQNNDVANKRYVDQMCSGLQNYIVSDFLLQDNDAVIEEEEFIPIDNLNKYEVTNLVFILTKRFSQLVEIIEIGEKIKFKNISFVSLPAKVCIKSGKYGQSEYIMFNNNNSLQMGGMESIEYSLPLEKNGKELKLNYNKDIYNEDLSLKEKIIGNNLLKDNCIASQNIQESSIESKHLQDNIIESRHIGNKVINQSHIHPKCIGDSHLKDGFLKNHHFTPGIISDKELGTECIGMTALKSSIILQKHLTKGCIKSDNIMEEEIQGKHLCERAIDSNHLMEKVIISEHLSNNLIKNDHLCERIIESKNLLENIIGSEHLKKNIITRDHITVNLINGLHIQENSINGSHINEQSIQEKHLTRNLIKNWHLSPKIIESSNVNDNCIEGKHINEKSLEERHFVEASIGSNIIKKNSINSSHITANCIDDKHIVNYSIKSPKLLDGCIIESKIAENSISTGKIKDNSISNDKIKLPFIKIQTDPVFTCTQMVYLGDTLNISLNQNYMVPKRRDGIVEFLSSVKFGEEGTGQRMQIHMDLDVTSEVNFKGVVKENGLKINQIGEIKAIYNKIKLDENFLKKYTKCDGKRVKKNDFPELALALGEEDEFYIPDIKGDDIDYYIRII